MRSMTMTCGVHSRPDHLGDQHQIEPLHIAPQLGGVGRLTHQIELVVQVHVELGHHLAGLEAPAVAGQSLDPGGEHPQQREVVVDDLQHAGAQHLDGDLAAVVQLRKMHLGDRGTGDRLGIEAGEQRFDRASEGLLDESAGCRRPETAAHGPVAWPVRWRCRAAPDRGASTAPGRT
jgi:hypothetical protein